ncbi:MAG: SIR2 family protein [Pseudomonadota bacterium]
MLQDMTQEAHWENRSAVVSYLASQLIRGRLSVFLGAGASLAHGLPNWDGLLTALCAEHGIAFPPPGYPNDPTPLTLATSIRGRYRDKEEFKAGVKKVLYKNAKLDFASLASDRTFVALGSLVMASARGGVASVMTLNYDDCLEIYLENAGFVVDSLCTPAHWASRADLAIYHPHGFLPTDPGRNDSEDIVLDQFSFSERIGATGSPWYQKIVTILRNSTVLMIGFGSGDQNLLAMLQNARIEHPIGTEKPPYNGVLLKAVPNSFSVDTYKKYGIYTFPVSDYVSDMPNLLYEICRVAASARRTELGLGG